MENIILYRGHDEQIIIQLYQDIDETIPVNIDDIDDVQIRIAIGKIILGQWNKTGSGDFTALTRIDAYNYSFVFETNDDSKLGHADMWIELQDADVSLEDAIDNSITAELNLFNVVEKSY